MTGGDRHNDRKQGAHVYQMVADTTSMNGVLAVLGIGRTICLNLQNAINMVIVIRRRSQHGLAAQ